MTQQNANKITAIAQPGNTFSEMYTINIYTGYLWTETYTYVAISNDNSYCPHEKEGTRVHKNLTTHYVEINKKNSRFDS